MQGILAEGRWTSPAEGRPDASGQGRYDTVCKAFVRGHSSSGLPSRVYFSTLATVRSTE